MLTVRLLGRNCRDPGRPGQRRAAIGWQGRVASPAYVAARALMRSVRWAPYCSRLARRVSYRFIIRYHLLYLISHNYYECYHLISSELLLLRNGLQARPNACY